MAGEMSRLDRFTAWAQQHPILALAGLLASLALLAFILSRGGDGGPADLAIGATTSTTFTTSGTTTTEVGRGPIDRPDVPPIPCETLITSDEADAALFGDETNSRGMFTFSQGETCRFNPDDDSGAVVQIGPGDRADFEAGAEISGIPGEVVEDVGDLARWFDDESTGVGVLSVGAATDLGTLIYRIYVGRTDLDGPARLDLARGLALQALPRFPGVTVEEPEPEPEPEIINFPDEPVDLAPSSLDDILDNGIDSGDWSMGEGLIAILDWMANRTPGVVEGSLSEVSGSGIVATAQSYLAGNPDDADEVRELLDQLLPAIPDRGTTTESTEAAASTVFMQIALVAQTEPEEPCATMEVDGLCLEEVPIDSEDLSLYVGLSGSSRWTDADVQAAKTALIDSSIVYDSIGDLPPTTLVLRPGGENLYAGYVPGEDCRVYVDDFLARIYPARLQQILAREIAFCLVENEFYPQLFGNPNPVEWLVYGLTNYLSGVVYPSTNLEHENLPTQLAQEELSTTIPDRSWTNWILFEHLHAFLGGGDGVMAMIRGFPEGGDLVAALAAAPGIPELYHDLERALSDSNVSDVGPGTVPYDPPAWELPLAGPSEIPLTVPQFGVRRLHIQVPPGQYACADSFSQGAVRMSWRTGVPGETGSWSDELPFSFEGDSVMVLTSVEPGADYTLDITDVDDDPDCSDDSDTPPNPEPEDCDLCGPSDYYWSEPDFEP